MHRTLLNCLVVAPYAIRAIAHGEVELLAEHAHRDNVLAVIGGVNRAAAVAFRIPFRNSFKSFAEPDEFNRAGELNRINILCFFLNLRNFRRDGRVCPKEACEHYPYYQAACKNGPCLRSSVCSLCHSPMQAGT